MIIHLNGAKEMEQRDTIMMRMTYDRRKHIRRSIILDILISTDHGDYIKARVRNLSLEGLAIAAPEIPLCEDQLVIVHFGAQPGNCSPERSIQARVIHVGAETVGLQYEQMGTEVHAVLHELLRPAKYF